MSSVSLKDILDQNSLSYHIENTTMATIVFNDKLEITYWSANAARIFGWTAEEISRLTPFEFSLVYEEDAASVYEKIEEIISGEKTSNQITNRNYTKTGETIYCEWHNSALKDSSGRITNALCLVQDVTEVTIAKQKLEQSQYQLSLIYNSAIDPMWLYGIEGQGRLRFENINEAFTLVTGWNREQVVGLLMEDVLPRTSHQLVRDKCNEAIRTGKIVDYIEVAVHPSGENVGEIRMIPVKDENGHVTKLVGIANDVTQKHALQKKLDQERDELQKKITAAVIKSQEQERNSVSRELHDNVNQVLTTVKLYTEICTSGSVDLDVFLPKCTKLLTETINDIRSLSKKLQGPVLNTTSLPDAIKELAAGIDATQKVAVQVDVSGQSCDSIDQDLQLALYRIAQEHLNNVIKHADAQKVIVKFQCTSSLLSLIIIDDGVGFDPKQKADGIGITNMKSRANLFGGQLYLRSSKGNGCTMTLSFPVTCIDGKCVSVF